MLLSVRLASLPAGSELECATVRAMHSWPSSMPGGCLMPHKQHMHHDVIRDPCNLGESTDENMCPLQAEIRRGWKNVFIIYVLNLALLRRRNQGQDELITYPCGENSSQKFSLETRRNVITLDVGGYEKVTLKRIYDRQNFMTWTGLNFIETGRETSGSIKAGQKDPGIFDRFFAFPKILHRVVYRSVQTPTDTPNSCCFKRY